ncbi:PREDICTED: uncharacterized protein LOC109154349 isoform X4 [Ipomoea nil]|uniref:uncharacterized protein LOC109154349 isoform X4 n=1 Tax=Ipomoea nil TaxID=35883 RepID=UPI0009010661|nr:PREDICTED: uncharacterized protein LOC109154349 isoform X4 [Ipomoea nil]
MASPASRQPRLLPPSKLSRPPVAPQIAHVFNFAADLRAQLNIAEDYAVPFLSSSLEATTERFCTSFLEISVHEYSVFAQKLWIRIGQFISVVVGLRIQVNVNSTQKLLNILERIPW